jgi:hypothetical protein
MSDIIAMLVAALGWETAEVGVGTGNDYRVIGTPELPVFNWDAVELIRSHWGDATVLAYLNGNGARVKAQAVARKVIREKGKVTGDAWKAAVVAAIVTGAKVRGPGVNVAEAVGSALSEAATRAFEGAYEDALENGLSEEVAQAMAEKAAARVTAK